MYVKKKRGVTLTIIGFFITSILMGAINEGLCSGPPLNYPPEVGFPNGPEFGRIGERYQYTCRVSDRDGDRMIVSFSFGDGKGSWAYSYSGYVSQSHIWDTPGDYGVSVVATEILDYGSYGASTSSGTLWVHIEGYPPYVPCTPSGPTSGKTGETYCYSTSTIDPDGDQVKYYFDWGDGTGNWSGVVDSNQSVSFSHTWSEVGTYDVRAKAQDIYGDESNWSSALQVTISSRSPDKPVTPSGRLTGRAGNEYNYTTAAIDPDGDQVQYGWDWDGDLAVDEWTPFYNSGDPVKTFHSWDKVGNYMIRVKAKDVHGTESEWSDPLSISMPKNEIISINLLIMQFLENHPNLFPILQQILLFLE